jgi:hypothetical protein
VSRDKNPTSKDSPGAKAWNAFVKREKEFQKQDKDSNPARNAAQAARGIDRRAERAMIRENVKAYGRRFPEHTTNAISKRVNGDEEDRRH